MNNVIGTKFKLVMGYKGSSEAQLAVERGEVEGHSTSWTALKVGHPDWIRNKDVKVIVQFSTKKHPDLQDVPTVVELAKTDEVFLVGTAAEVTPVGQVGDYRFKVGPVTRQLREDYLKEVRAHQNSAAA